MKEVSWQPENKDHTIHMMEIIRELNSVIHEVRNLQQNFVLLSGIVEKQTSKKKQKPPVASELSNE